MCMLHLMSLSECKHGTVLARQFVRKLEQFGHREGRKSKTVCLALLQRTTQITFAPCSRSSPPRTDNCVWQWAPIAQTAIVRARLHDLSRGVVTGLLIGRPRVSGSIRGVGNRFITAAKRPGRVWNHSFSRSAVSLRVKQLRREASSGQVRNEWSYISARTYAIVTYKRVALLYVYTAVYHWCTYVQFLHRFLIF
jgi:hypothetical protein